MACEDLWLKMEKVCVEGCDWGHKWLEQTYKGKVMVLQNALAVNFEAF